MNLAIRNINSKFVAWNTEGSFLKDAHPDLKADFVIANPPFNQKEWGIDILQDDARWQYGTPPNGNANFGWMQHMLYHLSPRGVMATVLANGSLSSNTSGEGDIRKTLVEAGLVECIVALPKQLFFNTGIPACIWFLRRGRTKTNEVLFIDASEMGYLKDRVHRDFSDADDENKKGDFHDDGLGDIQKITKTYHDWKTVIANDPSLRGTKQSDDESSYQNIKGYCKSATIEDIRKHNHVLTPGRYVGIPDEEDDGIPFSEKMADLTTTLQQQMQQEEALNQEIKTQLANIGFKL
jgi:type I restriction enzyme M protein